MRMTFACLALAACAIAPAPTPAARLVGCWVAQRPITLVMDWAPDPAQPEVMIGVRSDPARGESTRFSLAPSDQGPVFCELGPSDANQRCWGVAEGEGGSLEGGRAFIDRHGERLTIEILGASPSLIVFQGHSRRCG